MSRRAETFTARVVGRTELSRDLVRLELSGDGLADWESSGIPDEWVGLTVPGQYQSRYYTVRDWRDGVMTLDVVIHDVGLVTEWVSGDCVGQTVTITEPQGGFVLPPDAGWLYVLGDLTAFPAMARIMESIDPSLSAAVWAESADEPPAGYFPDRFIAAGDFMWLQAEPGQSGLAAFTESLPWLDEPGYFWMAGESAQMRAIRKYLSREVGLAKDAYHVMGYWRISGGSKLR